MEFKPEYVRCTWSPELEGKAVSFSDSIDTLWQEVCNSKDNRSLCEESRAVDYPFKCGIQNWRFVYYDPFFELKLAHEQGKIIQVLHADIWVDWLNPSWDDSRSYRIKPEEEKPEEEKPVTNRELALWLAQGNGQIYHHDDSGFRTEVKTSHGYHQEEDNFDCNINSNLHCKIRKWGETEWVAPTREYMGLEE